MNVANFFIKKEKNRCALIFYYKVTRVIFFENLLFFEYPTCFG